MPHIIFKSDFRINTPLHLSNGVCVDFVAHGTYESKIGITKGNSQFLLTKKKSDNGFLLKYDKYTRISPVKNIKFVLGEIANFLNQEIVFSNITINEKKVEPHKDYLKDISYFTNDFHFEGDICIEVGFGSGRHILYQAKENPNTLFVGLEIHSPSVEKMLKQVKLQNIQNILAINYDARLFLEFLQSNTITTIYVHFPVPWPKKPHRRVISSEFIDEALRALKVGGTLELRTDDEEYFVYSKDIAKTKNGLLTMYENQDLAVTSKYETRWKQMEKNIFDLHLECIENSDPIENQFDFSFKNIKSFKLLCDTFVLSTYVGDDFFVHFEEIYVIDANSGLIQVSFGSKNKPEAKYIKIENNQASYYQSYPVASKSNFKAHQKIMEQLQ